MNETTRRALNAINRHFYQHHAQRFSETRSKPWQGWSYVVRRLVERREGVTEPLRVLDVGCGNGRFGELLQKKFPKAVEYVGVDSSGPLLEHARERLRGRQDWSVELVQHDFVEAGLAEVVGERRFDLVVLFGVLHHIPGFEVRKRVIGELLGCLAPGGEVVLSVWRFAEDPRYQRRVVGWEEHNAWVRESGAGVEMLVDAGEVEEGDVLLRWGGAGSRWWRYCHAVGEGELGEMVKASGGVVVEAGVGDGGNGYWWLGEQRQVKVSSIGEGTQHAPD